MPRIARLVIKGYPHHVSQRGNYSQKIFFCDKDKLYYLSLIKKYSEKYRLSILAYCLMNNHVHFIVVPKKGDSMAKTFDVVNAKYSQFINKKKRLKGHLWESRFYSCCMDDNHAYVATRYLEQNPVKAKLVDEAWQWRWSSALFHIGEKDYSGILQKSDFLPQPDEWKKELKSTEPKIMINKLEWCTKTGRPFTEFSVIRKLEKIINKNLRQRRVGRPRKTEK
ncbi:MAG: transposase [Candidatus Omnitrophica bacterium]|nr:transposase [Candidatus Omnitrophota bacterium]